MENKMHQTNEQLSDDVNEYPPSVRFKARRAIINAMKDAKITDGTFKTNLFICRFSRNEALKSWLDSKRFQK